MKSHHRNSMLALLAALAFGATGCTIAATPNLSAAPTVATTHVVYQSPPPRVYYEGRWLHYRSDAYYYRTGPTWVVASTVPRHVHTYHRPQHYVSRPGPAHYSYSRPAPTHYSRPAHVRSSRPTHVQRTTSNRRTYYRR